MPPTPQSRPVLCVGRACDRGWGLDSALLVPAMRPTRRLLCIFGLPHTLTGHLLQAISLLTSTILPTVSIQGMRLVILGPLVTFILHVSMHRLLVSQDQ